jgi:hypothetical protein
MCAFGSTTGSEDGDAGGTNNGPEGDSETDIANERKWMTEGRKRRGQRHGTEQQHRNKRE